MPVRSSLIVVLSLAAFAVSAADLPPGHPPIDQMTMPAPSHAGTVEEIIPAKPYVYLRVKENGESQWLAAPEIAVAVGSQVRWADGMPMTNFQSKTLNRTFEKVLFVMRVEPVQAP